MRADTRKKYLEQRAAYPGLPASAALHYAKCKSAKPLDWKNDRHGNQMAEWKEAGFTLHATVEPDNCSPEGYSIGKFTDKWSPDVITRRNTSRREYKYYLPMITYVEHFRDLRKTHSKQEADTLARQYVREEFQRAENYGQDWGTYIVWVRAFRHGIELGSTSVGGVDSDGSATSLAYFTECARDLTSEAIREARTAVEKLCTDGEA